MSTTTSEGKRSDDDTIRHEDPRAAFTGPNSGLSGRQVGLLALLIVALCVGGALVGAFVPDGGRSGPSSSTTVAAPSKSAKTTVSGPGTFMGLTKLGDKPAPAIALIDQQGAQVSLAEFRGKVVVLTFLDDLCGSLCPVLDEELRGAYGDLGSSAGNVAFVAVNVDSAHGDPADLLSYTSTYGLSSIQPWFFLTGSAAQLAAVWADYGISVEPGPAGTMAYTAALFFITPAGLEAYEATPYADQLPDGSGTLPASSISSWAAGIAQYAKGLLSAGRAP